MQTNKSMFSPTECIKAECQNYEKISSDAKVSARYFVTQRAT